MADFLDFYCILYDYSGGFKYGVFYENPQN